MQTQAEKTGRSAGQRLVGALGNAAKKVAKGAVIGAGVAVGAALVSGFRSAIDQQNIQATVAGLYGDADKAFGTLNQIKQLSKTSPIDYSAYGKAAQSLAYAGVEGDQAVTILDKVGMAIVGAGGGSVELERAMTGILKGVNNGGVVMNDTLAMISESGFPIIDALSTKFGTTGDVIKKMAADGELSIDDVLSVMESGTGKLAQAQAAAGKEVAQTFGNQWKIAKDNVAVAIGETMIPLLERLAPMIGVVGAALVTAIQGLPGMFESIAAGAQKVFGFLQTWAPMIFAIVGAVVAWNAVQAISNALGWASYLWQSREVIIGAARIAITNAMTVAQQGLNAALRANPIGAIITLIMLLVGAFVMAYQNSETFRNIVQGAWAGIKIAAQAVANWFMTYVWPTLKAVWDGIAAGATWLWQNVMLPVWNGIKIAVAAVVTWFMTYVWPSLQMAVQILGQVFQWLYENVIKPVWSGISAAINVAWTVIKPVFNFIVQFIKAYLMVYFELLRVTVQLVWGAIQIAIQVAWTIVRVIFNAIVAFVRNVLGPIFTWLYNNVIKPVWNGIKLFITTAWAGIRVVFNAIRSFLQTVLGPVFRWLYNNVIRPVWNGIRTFISTAWNGIKATFQAIVTFLRQTLSSAFRWLRDGVVKPVWNGIRTAINSVWTFVRDKVFDPLKNAVRNTVPNAFEKGKDAIGKAWNKVKSIAKKPVKFVIETVINNGIIKGFNKIASKFGVDEIKEISLPKGFDTGGYTGAGRKYKPAGIVHADEYVIRKESQRKITRRHGRGVLDHMNRFGTIPGFPGYAKGGKTLIDGANWWVAKGARGSRHPAFGGAVRSGHSRNSLHYQDRAVDLNYGPGGQNATEMAFFDRHVKEFKSLFPGIRVIWRAPGHYNHMHIDTGNGADIGDFSGAASGGGGVDISTFLNPFEKLFDTIKNKLPKAGAFGELVGAGAKKMVEAPIEWIKENAFKVADLVEGAASAAKDVVTTGAGRTRGRAWAAAQGWGIGDQRWKDLDYIITRESSWNHKAKNPRSTASGLGQFINATARAYLGGSPASKFPFDEQLKGVIAYVNDRYGGLAGARRFWERNNHYSTGGRVTPMLFDKGGTLQPGTSLVANKTRKPEYILPAKVTDALMNSGVASGDRKLAENLYLQGDAEQIIRELDRRERKRDLLYT